MANPFGLRLDLANNMLTNAARFHELITQEREPGENAFDVAITYDLLQSEIVHLKDRYDLTFHDALNETERTEHG